MVAEAFNPFAPVPRPAHVPLDRVVDWDIYNPRGINDGGFHKAWKALQDSTASAMPARRLRSVVVMALSFSVRILFKLSSCDWIKQRVSAYIMQRAFAYR